MKRISTLLFANKNIALLGGILLLWSATASAAVSEAVHDAHRLQSSDEFQNTIEARCSICHTRARVDTAISDQEDLDALLQRMIERGAILNEKDRNVLGTFWGSPLDEEAPKPPDFPTPNNK